MHSTHVRLQYWSAWGSNTHTHCNDVFQNAKSAEIKKLLVASQGHEARCDIRRPLWLEQVQNSIFLPGTLCVGCKESSTSTWVRAPWWWHWRTPLPTLLPTCSHLYVDWLAGKGRVVIFRKKSVAIQSAGVITSLCHVQVFNVKPSAATKDKAESILHRKTTIQNSDALTLLCSSAQPSKTARPDNSPLLS